jgi:hydrogenase maturation protease
MSEEEHVKSGLLVLGVGNTILTDEGVGPWVVDRLRELNPEVHGVTWMDGGTLSFSIAADVEDAEHLIVVDATELKSPPGTVKVFVDEEMDRMLGGHGRSIHEVGLLDLMNMARLTGAPADTSRAGRNPARDHRLGHRAEPRGRRGDARGRAAPWPR